MVAPYEESITHKQLLEVCCYFCSVPCCLFIFFAAVCPYLYILAIITHDDVSWVVIIVYASISLVCFLLTMLVIAVYFCFTIHLCIKQSKRSKQVEIAQDDSIGYEMTPNDEIKKQNFVYTAINDEEQLDV